MISFESFDHMLRFAKEVDEGLCYLEEKLKNPARLLYCDREENAKKAAHCFDSLEKELDDIHEEVSDMITTETEDLEMMLEERDKITKYLNDIEKEMKKHEQKLIPYRYKCKKDVKKAQQNLCNIENEEPLECSLESSTTKVKKNVTFVVNQTNFNCTNKSFLESYTTPKHSQRSVQSLRNKPKRFTGSVQSSTNEPKRLAGSLQSSTNKSNFFERSLQFSTNKSKLFQESLQSSTNIPKRLEGSLQSSRNKLLSTKSHEVGNNSDNLWTAEKARIPLKVKNDIATPNINTALFSKTEIYTPPDPGFSVTSRQVYALSVGRLKQKKLKN